MNRKALATSTLAMLCAAVFAAESKYANPALNPVTFETPVSQNKIELVKNGELKFAIVCDLSKETGKAAKEKHIYAVRRSVALAAEGIQHAFATSTGKKPVILKPDSPKLAQYPFWIVLGDNPITRKNGLDPSKLEFDEFKVFTFDRGIIIAGYDGSTYNYYNALDISRIRINGTAYGAYDFCERFVGMRYYYPNIGIYAPKVTDLTVDPVSYHDKPFMKYHYSYSLSDKKAPDKPVLSDFSPAWRNGAATRFYGGHTPDPQALAKAYPDKLDLFFFRNRAGHLYYNPRAHIGNYFDITNPAFADFFVDEMVTKFYAGDQKIRTAWGKHKPNSEYIPFGQADTYVADVLNERSKPYIIDSRKGLRTGCLTDLYVHFYVELAKKLKVKFPDRKVAMSAYSSRTLPPVKQYDWPDNLMIKISMGCPVMTPSPAFRKAWKNIFAGWHKAAGKPAGGYTYGVGTYAITAAIQGRYMGDFIKNLGDDLWREYFFFDAGHNNQFYYSYYPAYRAMWNPDFNVQAALDEHWALLYGPEAGKYLKEFYDLLVTTWEKKVIPQIKTISEDASCRASVKPKTLYDGFDLKTIDKMDALLKKAQKAVKKGSIEAQRLDYFLGPWKKQITSARAYHTTTTKVQWVNRLNPGETITVDGNGNDPAWQRAKVCELKDCQGEGRVFPEKPTAKMMWNDQGIYLLVTALKKPKDNPGEIWKFCDCWEWLFSPGMKKDYFYHFGFNPHGDLYQAERDVTEGVGGVFKCAGIQIKSKYDDNGWTAELFVPFAGLRRKPPKPYEVWFGNIIYTQRRSNTANNLGASFTFTMKNNRNTDLWGQFKFMGYGD